LLGGWKKHPVFVVGEGTSKILKKELCLDGEGSNAGNSSALAEIILQSELRVLSKALLGRCHKYFC
jgi:hypothetical protein